jgi:hypothetical protein
MKPVFCLSWPAILPNLSDLREWRYIIPAGVRGLKGRLANYFFLALCNTGDKCEHVSGEFGDIMTLLA